MKTKPKQYFQNLKLLALLLAFACSVFQCGKQPLTSPIQTSSGKVQGVRTENKHIALFSGIPYAAPPVGELRWRAPEPPPPWQGVRKAVEFGPECIQERSLMGKMVQHLSTGLGHGWWKRQLLGLFISLAPAPDESEDCLYLNVRTANPSPKKLRPVMVWIHGGAFVNGAGSQELFQANALVKRGVVLVTVNYRLGAFGFFATPALRAEGPGAGNYGLLDQMAALRWVRDNIAAFGGDPGNVTIFGESAGSMSVSFLLASPLAQGLFHKAIMQSGVSGHLGGKLEEPGFNKLSALAAGTQMARLLGVDQASASALRAVPARDILKCIRQCVDLQWREQIGPVVDGYVLPMSVGRAISEGKMARVPILNGYNAHDASILYPFFRSPTVWERPLKDLARVKDFLQPHFGQDTARLLQLYNLGNSVSAKAGVIDMLSDDLFGVSHRFLSGKHAMPAYLYIFKWKPDGPAHTLGSYHAAEIPFVFDSFDGFFFVANEQDKVLSSKIMGYWLNFAKTGNPNGSGLPEWPPYSRAGDQWLILDHEIKIETGVRREKLNILERKLISKLLE